MRQVHRTLVARILASVLLLLAASPITAPFATIELSDFIAHEPQPAPAPRPGPAPAPTPAPAPQPVTVCAAACGAAKAEFQPNGDHLYVCDTKSDGLGTVAQYTRQDTPGQNNEAWNRGGAGTCIDHNMDLVEGTSMSAAIISDTGAHRWRTDTGSISYPTVPFPRIAMPATA